MHPFLSGSSTRNTRVVCLLLSTFAAACSSDSASEGVGNDAGQTDAQKSDAEPRDSAPPTGPCDPDETKTVPERQNAGEWQRVDLPEGRCSNGSPYAIFVNYSDVSNNVLFMLEPGGACWDYESCSPGGGLRGAANPDGIRPDLRHIDTLQYLPLLRKDVEEADNPVRDWNLVFVPYCTGDVHTGNNTATYTGPNGEELVFHHEGHKNVEHVTRWVGENFEDIPRLLVTGCSAGGAGSLLNYHFIRKGLGDAVQCGYLLDDSGPIFPSDGNSGPLHEKVRESWNGDSVLESLSDDLVNLTVDDLKDDFGKINVALAELYPRDRMSLAVFRRDLNYSLYSYERFYDDLTYTDIHELWDEDIDLLRGVFDEHENLAYYIPFWRVDNCSHCVSIPPVGLSGEDAIAGLATPWKNSNIEDDAIDLNQFVRDLLDDTKPLTSYYEDEQADEGFTSEQAMVCQEL